MDLLTMRSDPPPVFSDPKVSAPIEKIVIPKGGGIDTYLKGLKYPYPGYPDHRRLEIICIIKRTFLTWMHFFSPLKRNIFKLILFKKNLKKFIPEGIYFLAWILRNHRLKPQFYSRPVREIYRLFDILIERSNEGLKGKFTSIRDIVCMVLEFDDAYRFMVQDIIAEMDVDKIKMDERDSFFASKYNTKEIHYDFGGKNLKQNKIIEK